MTNHAHFNNEQDIRYPNDEPSITTNSTALNHSISPNPSIGLSNGGIITRGNYYMQICWPTEISVTLIVGYILCPTDSPDGGVTVCPRGTVLAT